MSVGTFLISDNLCMEGALDTPAFDEAFDIKDIWVDPRYAYTYTIEAESFHFRNGPGLYLITMRKDEGEEPYVLRADKIEEANHAVQ